MELKILSNQNLVKEKNKMNKTETGKSYKMKKILAIITLLVLFISCANSDENGKTTAKQNSAIDSLTIEKETKNEAIKTLNSELDSLKRLRDSLKSIADSSLAK